MTTQEMLENCEIVPDVYDLVKENGQWENMN